MAPKPVVLFSFNSQKAVDQWHVFTDAFFGGKSEATFTYSAQEQVTTSTNRPVEVLFIHRDRAGHICNDAVRHHAANLLQNLQFHV